MENTRGFLLGFLVGALLGAAVALLYAPQPGEQTREVVGKKAAEVVERGRKLLKREEREAEKAEEGGGEEE